FIFSWPRTGGPLLLRGDSHRLIPRKGVKEFFRAGWIRHVFQRFAAFLYVGRANRNYFRYHDVAEGKLFFSPHSVDNERFITQTETARRQAAQWKQELGIPSERRVILFAGKFESKKRPLDLVMAFKQAALKNVALVLVGAGPLESELRAQ